MKKINILIILSIIFLQGNAFALPFKSIYIPPFLKNAGTKAKEFIPPKVEKFYLSPGHKLYALNNSDLPLINLSLIFNGGDILLPANEVSLFSLLSTTLSESGGGKYNGEKLQDILDQHGIRFSIQASKTKIRLSFSLLKKDLALVTDIITQLLKYPSYSQEILNNNKARKIENIKRRNSRPGKIIRRKLNELLFQNSILGVSPSVQNVKNIKLSSLQKWHKKIFNKANCDILISGDIENTAYLLKFKNLLSSLNSQKKSYKNIIWLKIKEAVQKSPYSQKDKTSKTDYFFIPKALPQSTILWGSFAMPHNSKDYYAAKVMNFILGGGGFNSRFFREIRSNQGLAYSVYSYFSPSRDYGMWKAVAQTKSSSTLKVLDEMKNLINSVSQNYVTDAELQWAKQSIINKYVFIFEKTPQIVNQIYSLEQEKLSLEFLTNFRSEISKVSKEDVQKQAAKYLMHKPKLVIIVGNKSVFESLKQKYPFKIIKLEK